MKHLLFIALVFFSFFSLAKFGKSTNLLGVIAFVLTKYGMREWHFYVRDKQQLGAKINHALSTFPKLPLHIQIESDESWNELQAVYEFCESP